MRNPTVAFIYVHNSFLNQMAEALGIKLCSNVLDAGVEPKPQISQESVWLMKQVHDIDMEQTQYSTLLLELPEIDNVIIMDCNVPCPFLPCNHREDRVLEDPTGKENASFLTDMGRIEENVLNSKRRIQGGIIG